jgi:lysozyme
MNFIQRVALSKGDLPPVLDVEHTNGLSKQIFQSEVKEWLQIIEQHYGVKPIIYTYTNFYENNLSEGFDEYPFWIAHYNGSDAPRSSRQWHFWQHNEKGHVNGINSFVDFNVFNGDSTAFNNLCIQ